MKLLPYVVCVLMILNTAYAQKLKSRGRAFNPDIGVNALLLGQHSTRDSDEDGFKVQEVELQFKADVDSYFTSWILFGIEKEEGSDEYAVEPEEAFVETTSIPYIIIRAGKSKMPIGKHNELHVHSFPFINAPLINENILGEEGLSETGVGVSWLVPLLWFSEVSLHYTQGDNDELFNSGQSTNKAVIGRYKNLWNLSDSTTFEVGLSWAKGKNSDRLDTTLFGGDFTIKWRPVKGGKYHSFEWGNEFLRKNRRGASDGKLSGLVSHLKFQLTERWYFQYRYDYLGLNSSRAVDISQRHTALLAFLPSEFSGLRFQYERLNDGELKDEKRAMLQFNISIGAHPAHAY